RRSGDGVVGHAWLDLAGLVGAPAPHAAIGQPHARVAMTGRDLDGGRRVGHGARAFGRRPAAVAELALFAAAPAEDRAFAATHAGVCVAGRDFGHAAHARDGDRGRPHGALAIALLARAIVAPARERALASHRADVIGAARERDDVVQPAHGRAGPRARTRSGAALAVPELAFGVAPP